MILVVDDSEEIIELWRDVITDAGYHFDGATDAGVALYKMSRVYYSMALIDLIMPGIGGVGLAKAIKDLPSPFCETPLVAMTGGEIGDEDIELFAATVQKPFLPRDLRALIEHHARPPIKDLHIDKAKEEGEG